MAKAARKKAPAAAKGKKGLAKHATPQKKKKPAPQKKAAAERPQGCMAWRHTVLLSTNNKNNKKTQEGKAIVPYTLQADSNDDDDDTERFWPSALFFDAKYANGILVDNGNGTDNDAADEPYFVKSQGYSNGNDDGDSDSRGARSRPCLTDVEAQMWCHKHAAHTAVARRFPVEVGRLLGTITLDFQERVGPLPLPSTNKKKRKGQPKTDSPLPSSLQSLVDKQLNAILTPRSVRAQVKQMTPKQSMDEAQREALQAPFTTTTTKTKAQQKARAQQIVKQWQAVQECQPFLEHWDRRDGSFNVNASPSASGGHGDAHHVPLKALQTWLANGLATNTLVDLQHDKVCELYNGLTAVPVNATDIFESLVNLADPTSAIYGVPLVVAYPRMVRSTPVAAAAAAGNTKKNKRNQRDKNGGNDGGTVWKVQLGVYMHRLLPEIFTCESLHIIMSALDQGSYNISQPLRLPPSGPAVFQSAPYPKVDTSVLERTYSIEEEKEDDDNTIEIIDVDMEGGSRDEMLLSPFSAQGLLKLLENKGCNVSNWPQIEQQLQGKFHLDLLLHQQHAICWMMQMEHLQGAYGINSLLWEQREFSEGGEKYYYSPALGQVRLGAPPPHMKGGLLCDEQGLGKTVEVLGLIMATLPELKRRVEKNADKKKASYKYEEDSYYSAQSSDDEDDFVAHTTLIIVPPALLVQWIHEIEKAVGKTNLSVSLLVAQTGELKKCLPPPPDSGDQASVDDEDDWDLILNSDIVVTTYQALEKNACSKVLQSVRWGRVVLDELQELRSSTTQIAKNCEKLRCDRRWMLSGTPIFQGIQDLRGELNFLRLEPFAADHEDGFFQFAIMDHWEAKHPHAITMLQILGLIALRRSKDMTIVGTNTGLLDLKPLTVEFIPVPQSHSERALYCWMEYLVACELQQTSDAKRKKKSTGEAMLHEGLPRTDAKSRALCLRLLRETCITPMLLNGGLGVASQLSSINQLMILHNRREQQTHAAERWRASDSDVGARKKRAAVPVMSCEKALRYLTQHQEAAKTNEAFVTNVVLGGGRGVTKRDRATESVETRCENARTDLADANRVLAQARKKRATARWHLALEMITSGQCSDSGRSHKFSSLWKWRSLVARAEDPETLNTSSTFVAELLTRGWRPSVMFGTELCEKHPDFGWAYPNALLAENIPKETAQKELASAIRDAAMLWPKAKTEHEKGTLRLEKFLQSREDGSKELKKGHDPSAALESLSKLLESQDKDNSKELKKVKDMREELDHLDEKLAKSRIHDSKLELPTVVQIRERKHVKGFWKAFIQFEHREDSAIAMKAFARSVGAPISTRRSVPHINAMEKVASEAVTQLESELKVHANEATKQKLTKAKKNWASISKGLRLVSSSRIVSLPGMDVEMREEAGTDHPYIIMAKALGQHRSPAPRRVSSLVESTSQTIADATSTIFQQKEISAKAQRVLHQLNRVTNGKVSEEIQQLSAYETLEILMDDKVELSQCPICLCPLGDGQDKEQKEVAISMISCGHFYCTACINDYAQSQLSQGDSPNCPSCRKAFSILTDTIKVDPSLKDERENRKQERIAAKSLVCEAAKMLEESNGHLDAEMWRALYLAFDMPPDATNQGSPQYPAIPREFLTHLRAATGMLTNSTRGDRPSPGSAKGSGRTSKIQQLLDDLPTKERCVVFSANKDSLMHIRVVLTEHKIGCAAIYTGQSTDELKSAVSNWETDGDSPTDSSPPFPCLLVQAGAAAAGLTLTAASKMFIMEPFIRQEEEKQAYARLHRYGQINKVFVKVYYTPVSVESRLLDWRKGAKSPLFATACSEEELCNFEQNTKIIVHEVDEESSSDEASTGSDYEDDGGDDSDGHDEIAQANYLLGLLD